MHNDNDSNWYFIYELFNCVLFNCVLSILWTRLKE